MRINKNGLDEMQKEKRNSIGNQMFLLMVYALLIDAGLAGVGISWLKYPSNIMVIIMVCVGIYLVRTIATNSYLPSKVSYRKTVISSIIAMAFSVVLVIAAFNFFGNLSVHSALEGTIDNSALILFMVALVGLLISLTVAIIKKVNDKRDSRDDD